MPHIAQRPRMRLSRDGGRTFPARAERDISTQLPQQPVTVPTCDATTGRGRLLVLDLDASKTPSGQHPADYITTVVDQVLALITECGGTALVDRSPSGGAHVYLLWSEPQPHQELRALARAFARRWPVVDTSPMESSTGQIRGPGAPHRITGDGLTGYMTLTCSLDEAEEICAHPCGPQVWAQLHVELAAELDDVTGGSVEAEHQDAPPAPLDLHGEPYLYRLGGRAPLRPDLEEVARTGRWHHLQPRYPTSSEVRQAILTSAACRGWRLEQIRAELAPGGAWTAISSWWRDDALLQAEWRKAIDYATRIAKTPVPHNTGKTVHSCNTSGTSITPPLPHPSWLSSFDARTATTGGRLDDDVSPTPKLYTVRPGEWWDLEIRAAPWRLSEYQRIRVWQQAMHIVERLQEQQWGQQALSIRAVLRAIGAAAQMVGSTTIEFGTRQLAYMTGLDHTTVSRVLKTLRTGRYALIDLVMQARGTRADVYQLVVPDAVAAEAAWRVWRPGRIEAIHPAFRVLGLPAAFAYEALSRMELTVLELATAALLSRSGTYRALQILASYGLAERGPGGRWRRGPADLNAVAAAVGADDLAAAQLAEHRADRAAWHALLGIVSALTTDDSPDQQKPGHRKRQAHANASHRNGQHRRADRQRHERTAPPWLLPPPPRPIYEADLPPPSEVLVVLAELHEEEVRRGGSPLPSDVRAAIREDLAAITADDACMAVERADYEAVLEAFRRANESSSRRQSGGRSPLEYVRLARSAHTLRADLRQGLQRDQTVAPRPKPVP